MPARTRAFALALLLMLSAVLTAGVPSAPTASGATGPGRSAPPDERPNIVLVVVDDMRTDELAFLDDTVRLMRAHGMEFPRALAPHPLCCPSRASLLTGQYAQNHGVQHNEGEYGGIGAMHDRSGTIATWLQDEGYRTSYIGKYLNGYTRLNVLEPGWTRWRALAHGPVSRYRSFQFYGDAEPTKGYITTAVSRETVGSVHGFAGPQPFFVLVNHTAPHNMLDGNGQEPPPPAPVHADHHVARDDLAFIDKPSFDEADVSDLPDALRRRPVERASQVELAKARIRSLQSVDDAMEDLFAALEQTGELADTWVVFTSDNGYLLGEHRLKRKNFLFRETLDVPLLVRGPGVPGDGSTNQRAVTLVDLAATVVELGGATATHPLDGASMVPLLRGEPVRWRDTVLVQTGRTGTDGRQAGWQYRGVLTARYLYAADVNGDPAGDVLFDRRRDPYEMRNVADNRRYHDVVAELDRRRRALQDCVGTACSRVFGPVPDPS